MVDDNIIAYTIEGTAAEKVDFYVWLKNRTPSDRVQLARVVRNFEKLGVPANVAWKQVYLLMKVSE